MQQMPVFVGHGDQDPLVPVQLARQTAQGLKTAGEAAGNPPVHAPSLQARTTPCAALQCIGSRLDTVSFVVSPVDVC